MLAVALYSGAVVLAQRRRHPPARSAACRRGCRQATPRRVRFDELHLLSTRLMMVNSSARWPCSSGKRASDPHQARLESGA